MIKKMVLVCAVLMVAGCAPSVQLVSDYKVGRNLDSGERSSASVGGVIYSEYEYTRGEGARILAPVNKKYGVVEHQVQSGTMLTGYLVDGRKKYCTNHKTVMDPIVGPWRISCFLDSDGDGKFDVVTVDIGDAGIEIVPTKYRINEISLNQSGYKYELVYQGISEGAINIAFREYKDSFTAPTFQQNARYMVESMSDNIILFRGAKILVHEANNVRIVYTVESGFE